MISRQKARRIAYQIVYNALTGAELVVGDDWNEGEQAAVHEQIDAILVELKKKSQ
jgi:hypothetical protein